MAEPANVVRQATSSPTTVEFPLFWAIDIPKSNVNGSALPIIHGATVSIGGVGVMLMARSEAAPAEAQFKPLSNWEETGKSDLWSDEMGVRLAKALADRSQRHRGPGETGAAVMRIEALQSEALARSIGEKEVKRFVAESERIAKAIPNEEPPPRDPARPFDRSVPTSASCVDGWGPYNAWEQQTEVWAPAIPHGYGPIDPVSTTSPRPLHPRVVLVAGAMLSGWGRWMWGSGCWLNVARTGTAQLEIDFIHNSHACGWGALGYCWGRIDFAGSVWGARENGWVDRGGAYLNLADFHYIGTDAPGGPWSGRT